MYSGADTEIVAKITGNIKIKTASTTRVKFNGNQSLKKTWDRIMSIYEKWD
mgnify:CR=1 FL=1